MSDLPKMSTWGTQGQKYEICDKAARERNTELGRETESIRSEVEALKQMSATAEELPSGSKPTASYSNGVLHLGIPQGPKGDTGAKGDKGEKGDKGDKGDTGPQGELGPQGIQGIQGEQGPKGDKGDTGDTGDTGPQGPAGEAGVTPNITVTAATGEPGTDVQVEQSGTAENPVLKFTIPRGNDGYVGADGEPGKSGVYIGIDTPTDPDVNVWIDTDGEEGLLDADTLEGKHAAEFALADHAHEIEDVTGLSDAIKTAMQGRAAQNLLDNSNFKINQRGQTSYTGSGYTIDRWRSWDSGFSMTVSDGGIVVSGGMLTQYIEKSLNGIYTLAAMTSSGTLYLLTANMHDAMTYEGNLGMGTPTDGAQAVSIGPGTYIWAALYEGAYTADTLPAYVPKGYAAELAECQRYYVKYISDSNTPLTVAVKISDTTCRATIMLPTIMRTKSPTVSASGCKANNTTITSINGIGCIGNGIMLNLNCDASTFSYNTGYYLAITPNGSIEISADL